MGLKEQAEASERVGRPLQVAAAGEQLTYPDGQPVQDITGQPGVITLPEPTEMDVPAHVAWQRVMGDVQHIAKADRTTSGSVYQYRGVDRVVDTVAPVLRRHGVIVMPVKVRAEYTVINTKSGAAMNYCRATVSFVVIGPRGDTLLMPNESGVMTAIVGEAIGEGFDTGDKSSMKAQSVAQREFYIKALAIPVTRPAADPEHGEQHEIAGPRRPTAAEYAAEIFSESTPIQRLQMIKQELDGDSRMAHTAVEGLDGEPIELGRLVRRVGAKRLADGGQGK